MKKSINLEEDFTFYTIDKIIYGDEKIIELTDTQVAWYEDTMDEFFNLQDFLMKKFNEVNNE